MKRWNLVLVVLVVALAPATAALAHPFGPPPTARVSASGRTVTVSWSATPDDAVAIGEKLGLMPAGSVAAYRQESAAQVAPPADAEARLSASPLLRDYLVERIAADQDGRPCQARVPAIPDFVHQGARVELRCPSDVTEVSLRITMLHDIHDAYRTVATGEASDPRQSVFTIATPEHQWRFGVAAGRRSPVPVAGIAALALAVIIAAVIVLARRRRRSSP